MSAVTPATETHENPPRFAIACPSCDYLLHGLGGPMVTCPECGDTCDVEELARRYRRQWSTTPRYERMIRPVVMSLLCALASPMVVLLVMHVLGRIGPAALAILGMMLVVIATVWIALAWSAVHGMPPARGIKLLLLLHVAVTGYLLAGVGMVTGVVALITLPLALFNATVDAIAIILCIAVILLGICSALLLRQCWKLDEHVGKACLDYALPEVK